jgi:hypothetical protein
MGSIAGKTRHTKPNFAVEPTRNSLRSVRRESDMGECGNTSGYPGIH